MNSGLENKIFKTVKTHGRGWVFSAKDFINFGNRDGIEVSLHRLLKKEKIRRIARGLYDFPKLGTLIVKWQSPDLDLVAEALARKYDWQIQPTESAILNLSGLSTQVPGRTVYMSTGPNRVISIGDSTVEFRKIKSTTKQQTFNKESYFKRTYNITIADYGTMLQKQNNCCAICNTSINELKKPLAIDHDHTTGKIRGLLCHICNTGLGYFKDSPTRLNAAISYLSKVIS